MMILPELVGSWGRASNGRTGSEVKACSEKRVGVLSRDPGYGFGYPPRAVGLASQISFDGNHDVIDACIPYESLAVEFHGEIGDRVFVPITRYRREAGIRWVGVVGIAGPAL